MKKYIVALDQGTTSCRAVIFDKQGCLVGKESIEFKQYYPKPGWVEQDPIEILNCQIEVLRMVLKNNQINPESIATIGITNQRETVVIWDKETGKPIYNAIVWQCRRTAEYCEQLKKAGLKSKIQDKTGLVIDAYFSATKIHWLLNNVPGAKERTKQGKLLAGTIDSWLLWNLTSEKIHATDYTNASRTMLYNIETLTWDNELLSIFDVPISILPEVRPSSGFFGNLDEKIIGVQTQIMGVAGDQQASLFGQGCLSTGMAKNTYGTGCFILMNTAHEKINSKNNLITTLACGYDGKLQYALEGSVFIAGSVVKWLRDELKIINNAEETEEIANRTTDSKGVYFVPAFVGLGAPYWDMYARGAIVGMTLDAGRDHIVRAAIESIAYQTKDVVKAMELDSGIKLNELRVDGGCSNNGFLMQFQSDILGTEVRTSSNFEVTSQGAAFLAGLATEFWQVKDIQEMLNEGKTFSPKMSQYERIEKYNGWKDAVKRCR